MVEHLNQSQPNHVSDHRPHPVKLAECNPICDLSGGLRGGGHDRAEEGGGDCDARGLHGRCHGGAG